MTRLSPAAAALLSDIAAAHGLAGLVPGPDGAIPVEIGDEPLVMVFAQAWDSVVLSAVLAWDASALGRSVYRAFAVRSRFAGRSTRVAREPRSGALVLVAEIGLSGLHYPAFEAELTLFLADLKRARAGMGLAAVDA